jgi:hypothetical protein
VLTAQIGISSTIWHLKNGGFSMKELTGSKHPGFRSAALIATAIGAVSVGAFAIGALAIGRLAIRRIVVGNAKFKSVEIEELTVHRLRVSDSLQLPSGSAGRQIS